MKRRNPRPHLPGWENEERRMYQRRADSGDLNAIKKLAEMALEYRSFQLVQDALDLAKHNISMGHPIYKFVKKAYDELEPRRSNPRTNPDEDIRDLERRVSEGDMAALARLEAERWRRGHYREVEEFLAQLKELLKKANGARRSNKTTLDTFKILKAMRVSIGLNARTGEAFGPSEHRRFVDRWRRDKYYFGKEAWKWFRSEDGNFLGIPFVVVVAAGGRTSQGYTAPPTALVAHDMPAGQVGVQISRGWGGFDEFSLARDRSHEAEMIHNWMTRRRSDKLTIDINRFLDWNRLVMLGVIKP